MCIVRYLAAFLVSIHWMRVAPLLPDMTIKNVSKHCQMSPGGGGGVELPLVENHWAKGQLLGVLAKLLTWEPEEEGLALPSCLGQHKATYRGAPEAQVAFSVSNLPE